MPDLLTDACASIIQEVRAETNRVERETNVRPVVASRSDSYTQKDANATLDQEAKERAAEKKKSKEAAAESARREREAGASSDQQTSAGEPSSATAKKSSK